LLPCFVFLLTVENMGLLFAILYNNFTGVWGGKTHRILDFKFRLKDSKFQISRSLKPPNSFGT